MQHLLPHPILLNPQYLRRQALDKNERPGYKENVVICSLVYRFTPETHDVNRLGTLFMLTFLPLLSWVNGAHWVRKQRTQLVDNWSDCLGNPCAPTKNFSL